MVTLSMISKTLANIAEREGCRFKFGGDPIESEEFFDADGMLGFVVANFKGMAKQHRMDNWIGEKFPLQCVPTSDSMLGVSVVTDELSLTNTDSIMVLATLWSSFLDMVAIMKSNQEVDLRNNEAIVIESQKLASCCTMLNGVNALYDAPQITKSPGISSLDQNSSSLFGLTS